MKFLWSRRALILYAGLAFGVLSAFLVTKGNPANMGVCTLCFLRDIAGALGLQHAGASINSTVTPAVISAGTTQYLRPELIGLALGAFATSLGFREFRARGGSSPVIRFFLGVFIAIGALVFLGCPWRMILRLAGGDLSALWGLVGLLTGVTVGIFFLKRGFSLGRATRTFTLAGWVMPVFWVALLAFALWPTVFSFISKSTGGPGSQFAPLAISLAIGLFIGFAAQRTRFCTMGGWRDLILVRDNYLFLGLVGLFVGALVANYAFGLFDHATTASLKAFGGNAYHWAFTKQFIALPGVDAAGHLRWLDFLWDGLGLALVGLAATLAGGCPLRQLVLSNEGDTDAGITVLGMIGGGAIAMAWGIASSASGTGKFGPWAVGVGLVACLIIGFVMREKATA